MKNTDIARVFSDVADLLEMKGENRFKIRAYQRVVRAIEHLPVDVEMLVAQDRLREIPGVGEAITQKITELVTTGKLGYYEQLKAEFPPGVSTLLTIPGIGPRTAVLLACDLGIETVDHLEAAIRSGQVAALPRMGAKTAANIQHQIQALRRKDQRIRIGEAMLVVDEITDGLSQVSGLQQLTPAGSLRRFRETVGDIDVMGTADDARSVIEAFTGLSGVQEVLASGDTKASVVVSRGLQVDLRIVSPDSFGATLQYFTGSKQHNINLRERARHRGLSLSEYGITELASGRLERFATEEAFYQRQGLDYIPPEIREGQHEIEQAEQGTLPHLVVLPDIKGDLHVHTDWSDGQHAIAAMARAAREKGYQYLAITDHSAGRGIAHGLDARRLRQQMRQIDQLNQQVDGVQLLKGIEVDIRADGSLDLPDELLAELDIVVAAVHSAMNQPPERMTRRLIGAMENPHVDIIAHPTCRLLPDREPVALDMEAVLKAAVRTKTALEINAMPNRLDLKDIHCYRARELGVPLVIGTDAHRIDHLSFMRFGVGVARRGWCQAGDILNTRSWPQVRAGLK